MVNDDKTENTILKRFKQTKNSKKEPWRDNQIRIKAKRQRRYCLQTTTFNRSLKKLEEIIKRQGKFSTEKKVKHPSKSVLLYNSSTFGPSMNDKNAPDSLHIKQFGKIVGVQYRTKMRNEKVNEVTKTKPLMIDITRAKWKLWCHLLRLNEKLPVRKAMKHLLIKP